MINSSPTSSPETTNRPGELPLAVKRWLAALLPSPGAWHSRPMDRGCTILPEPASPVRRAQVESLYVEAMLLADEAHSAFAAGRDLGRPGRDSLLQVSLACESLKTTTRLMHIIAWLLHPQAMFGGDEDAGQNERPPRLGPPAPAPL